MCQIKFKALYNFVFFIFLFGITMTLFLTMLPFYVMGNLHCLGMCGPLAMMLSNHKHRNFYFLGRVTSFTIVAAIAGGAGAILSLGLKEIHLGAFLSFACGFIILLAAIAALRNRPYPGYQFLNKRFSTISQSLSLLMLKDQALPSFLFGFFTVLLPCGQSLIVFSACALSGSLFVGFINGFAFALITSPSLFLAMHAKKLFSSIKKYYNLFVGVFGIFVACLAFCRGLAEMEIIPHCIVSNQYHIILY